MPAGIRGLNLSTRAVNILREQGIATMGELRKWASQANRKHLATVFNLGPKTLSEIRFAIHEYDRKQSGS
jgi:DNA-directed RNA polymerase alpha subunit